MSSRLRVEQALALVPDFDEFLPLTDALIGASRADEEKTWASSSPYATLGKRVVHASQLAELVPRLTERVQQHLHQLFTLVLGGIAEQEGGNHAGAAERLIRAGELEEGVRRFRQAERIYHLALDLARDLREKGPHILALRRLGRVCRAQGRLDEAEAWYTQSYQLSVDQLDLAGQAIACQGLGNLCDDRGQRERSRAWYERGLALARGLDDPALVWPFYTNLSVVARKSEDLDRAEALLAEARERIAAAGDGAALFFWYNGKGQVLVARGDAAGAVRLYTEALGQKPEPFWEMTLRINLGHARIAQDRLFEAEEEARRAEELAIVNRFVADLVDVYELLGSIARARRDGEGFVFYEQALEVCRERGLPPKTEAAIYHGYGRLYLECGQAPDAVPYLERARDLYAGLGLDIELARVSDELHAASSRDA